jgi:putative ABC transport system permease protein
VFLRVMARSFAESPRRKILAGAALATGIAVATATLSVVLDVQDRLAREFRSLGANLVVTPKADTLPLDVGGVDYRPIDEGAYLPIGEIGKLRTIFWRLNIVGFAPFIEVPIEARASGARVIAPLLTLIGTWYDHIVPVPDGTTFAAGVGRTHPWWRVDGRWFGDGEGACVVGAALARRAGIRAGDRIEARAGAAKVGLQVAGLLQTGGPEEEAVVAPLEVAQELAGRQGVYRRLMVSALTKPEDAFARKDQATMSPSEYDRWYCTPYLTSIAHQIEEVLPGTEARPMRRVAESEGRILSRVGRLMWMVTVAALVASALAVGASSASAVLERRTEIGLLKALGASNGAVTSFFLADQALLAVAGGTAGYAAGLFLARGVGEIVFGLPPTERPLLLPVILALALGVALAGNLLPLRRAAAIAPAPILRGE